MDKTSIKTDIIRFIESKGHVSKSAICDHLRDTKGTLGETTGRRLRELIEAGVIEKFQKEDIDFGMYTAYRVVKEESREEADLEKNRLLFLEQKLNL